MSVRDTQSATVGVLQTAYLRSHSSDWIEMSYAALPVRIAKRRASSLGSRAILPAAPRHPALGEEHGSALAWGGQSATRLRASGAVPDHQPSPGTASRRRAVPRARRQRALPYLSWRSS